MSFGSGASRVLSLAGGVEEVKAVGVEGEAGEDGAFPVLPAC